MAVASLFVGNPSFIPGDPPVRERLTNAGKKEQRQINQILDKEGRQGAKEAEARTVPKEHSLRKPPAK
jgi:hypothetical protein